MAGKAKVFGDLMHRDDWLESGREPALDPDRPIIDPHHHFWTDRGGARYMLDDLRNDAAGHNILKTVFIECKAHYLPDGPEHMRPIGETQFVVEQAKASQDGNSPEVAGIIAHADLHLDLPLLDEILDAHVAQGAGLFRGIRHALSHEADPTPLYNPPRHPAAQFKDHRFLRGLAHLGERGLTYDSWHFHHQNLEFLAMAKFAPGTTMVLNHFGVPLGVGAYADQKAEIFEFWKRSISLIAECPNTIAKLGGLAMPDNGYDFHKRAKPPSSDDIVAEQAAYYHHTIEAFGPERCMFESNFPVDRVSLPYGTYWNAMKKIAADYPLKSQDAMFHDTAARVYSL